MHHQVIRHRILFTLYLKHYSDQLNQPQLTDNIIKEAGLEYVERNMVYGDIIYLKESNLIKGVDIIGQSYPYALVITAKGIDKVENMIDKFARFLENHSNEELKIEYRTLEAMGMSSGLTTPILREIKRIIEKYDKQFAVFITEVLQ